MVHTTGRVLAGELGKTESDDLFYSMEDANARKIKEKKE
jgi:hypothetical protein